jgi:hypothetical protein
MPQTSYPFDSGAGATVSETQFSQMFRRLQSTGVSGSTATTDLKPFGDSSGLNVKVPLGNAIVRGHFYNSTATETLTISAANATNPRNDLVVLRLDPTANTIVLAVVTGTAAASPTDPTLSQTDTGTFEMPLARVSVAAGATTIAAGNVTDLRPFLGTQFGRWSTTTRPASPLIGTAGFNSTLAVPEYWNGSAWVAFTNTVTASMISATEQTAISAGRLRSGAASGGTAFAIYVQSTTPTGAATGDLWFW